MRHGLHLSKLSRTTSHRMLMLRNLVSSLLQHQQVSTTLPKAKAAAKLAEQVIGWGKKGGKDNWDRANGFLLNGKDTLEPLFTTLAKRYSSRPGGYTRILRSGYRVGDNAPLAVLELVDNKNDLRFENSAKTVGRELAIRTREQNLDKTSFKLWRETIEAGGESGIVDRLTNSKELGDITKKNVKKALQFRLNELSLPVSKESTVKPISTLPSTTSTTTSTEPITSDNTISTTSSTIDEVKALHPSILFLDRVYHHYLSSLAQFSLLSSTTSSSSLSLGSPDPLRQISQLTQRLHPSESKTPPSPVLTVPTIGKKFFAGERTDGYLVQQEGVVGGGGVGLGPISRAKGDWSKQSLDRKRRVVRKHATEEMDQLEKEFEEAKL
ncbi:hypothetical protein JCM5350_005993 [Sporobolomyces pararoseus]